MLRVRFAPSPTGFLHIGSARTFIFNWLYARHHGGAMILRIDDTDVERNTQSSLDSIFDGLRWLDLGWDEQYRQSERPAVHRETAQAIFQKGMAYRDFTPAQAGRAVLDLGEAPVVNDIALQRDALGAQRTLIDGVIRVAFHVDYERTDVPRLVAFRVDDHAATHRAVRTGGPRFRGTRDLQRAGFRVCRCNVESKESGAGGAHPEEVSSRRGHTGSSLRLQCIKHSNRRPCQVVANPGLTPFSGAVCRKMAVFPRVCPAGMRSPIVAHEALREPTRNSLILRRARWDRRSLFVVCRLVATLRSTTGHTRRCPAPPAVPLAGETPASVSHPIPPRRRRGKGSALTSSRPSVESSPAASRPGSLRQPAYPSGRSLWSARRRRRPPAPAPSRSRPEASARHRPAPPDRATAAATPPVAGSGPPVPGSAHRWPPSARIHAAEAPPRRGCLWGSQPLWPPPVAGRARFHSPAEPHPPAGSSASGWCTSRRDAAGLVPTLPPHPPARAAAPPGGLPPSAPASACSRRDAVCRSTPAFGSPAPCARTSNPHPPWTPATRSAPQPPPPAARSSSPPSPPSCTPPTCTSHRPGCAPSLPAPVCRHRPTSGPRRNDRPPGSDDPGSSPTREVRDSPWRRLRPATSARARIAPRFLAAGPDAAPRPSRSEPCRVSPAASARAG